MISAWWKINRFFSSPFETWRANPNWRAWGMHVGEQKLLGFSFSIKSTVGVSQGCRGSRDAHLAQAGWGQRQWDVAQTWLFCPNNPLCHVRNEAETPAFCIVATCAAVISRFFRIPVGLPTQVVTKVSALMSNPARTCKFSNFSGRALLPPSKRTSLAAVLCWKCFKSFDLKMT